MKIQSERSTLQPPRKQERIPYIFKSWRRWKSIFTTTLINSPNPWRKKPRRNERGNDNEKEDVLSLVHASFSEIAKAFHIEIVFNLNAIRRFIRICRLETRKFFINLQLLRLEHRMRSFKRLSLIAEKCENRLDFGDRSLVCNEIVEIIEKFGETHKNSDLVPTPLATSLSSVAEDHHHLDQ